MARHVEMLTRAGEDQIKRYTNAIKNHFGGRLGKLPVAAVEHEDIVLWVKYMQGKTYKDKPLSAKTIANHHGLLSASMETAVRLRLRGDNPCKGVQLPRDESIKEKMHFMTAAESLAVVQAHPARYQPLMAFLRGTGARFGEATALLGRDFQLDVQQPTVRIEKAWKRRQERPVLRRAAEDQEIAPHRQPVAVARRRRPAMGGSRGPGRLGVHDDATADRSGTPRSTTSGRPPWSRSATASPGSGRASTTCATLTRR
jgi:integrase